MISSDCTKSNVAISEKLAWVLNEVSAKMFEWLEVCETCGTGVAELATEMTRAQKRELTRLGIAKQKPGSAFNSSPDLGCFQHPSSDNT